VPLGTELELEKMANNKHTPGPWVMAEDKPNTGAYIVTAGNKVASKVVASITAKYEDVMIMAASPELLEMLERAVRLYERELYHLLPSKDADAFLTSARHAIRRARGAI
jgi:hypothetical protein